MVRLPYYIGAMKGPADDAFELFTTLASINSKYNLIEKNPRVYGEGLRVCPSMVRAVVLIERSPGMNITRLARGLGVTKASASELTGKLVESGLVRRAKDPGKAKEVLLYATDKCREIAEDVDRRHRRMHQDLESVLGEIKGDGGKLVLKVLKKVESHLDRYLRERG